MFPKIFKTQNLVVLLMFCGCLFLPPAFSFAGPVQVNLNTATAEQLETLPGIGPDLAQRILNYRDDNGPFKNIEGLLNVKGIGDGKFNKLRDMVTVEISGPSATNLMGTAK